MFKRISVAEAQDMLSPADGVEGDVQVVDIRDEESYTRAHISGAMHLHNSNIQEFIMEADPERPVIVCCYHGHMSQSAAAYLAEQGFHKTYSLDGGYEAWSESEDEASASS